MARNVALNRKDMAPIVKSFDNIARSFTGPSDRFFKFDVKHSKDPEQTKAMYEIVMPLYIKAMELTRDEIESRSVLFKEDIETILDEKSTQVYEGYIRTTSPAQQLENNMRVAITKNGKTILIEEQLKGLLHPTLQHTLDLYDKCHKDRGKRK